MVLQSALSVIYCLQYKWVYRWTIGISPVIRLWTENACYLGEFELEVCVVESLSGNRHTLWPCHTFDLANCPEFRGINKTRWQREKKESLLMLPRSNCKTMGCFFLSVVFYINLGNAIFEFARFLISIGKRQSISCKTLFYLRAGKKKISTIVRYR